MNRLSKVARKITFLLVPLRDNAWAKSNCGVDCSLMMAQFSACESELLGSGKNCCHI